MINSRLCTPPFCHSNSPEFNVVFFFFPLTLRNGERPIWRGCVDFVIVYGLRERPAVRNIGIWQRDRHLYVLYFYTYISFKFFVPIHRRANTIPRHYLYCVVVRKKRVPSGVGRKYKFQVILLLLLDNNNKNHHGETTRDATVGYARLSPFISFLIARSLFFFHSALVGTRSIVCLPGLHVSTLGGVRIASQSIHHNILLYRADENLIGNLQVLKRIAAWYFHRNSDAPPLYVRRRPAHRFRSANDFGRGLQNAEHAVKISTCPV